MTGNFEIMITINSYHVEGSFTFCSLDTAFSILLVVVDSLTVILLQPPLYAYCIANGSI